MKAVVCIVVLCSLVALTLGEGCQNASDCQHVTCPENDYTLNCVQSQCTCTHVTATCSFQSDCTGNNCQFGWHCVDNRCRCGFGFPTGK